MSRSHIWTLALGVMACGAPPSPAPRPLAAPAPSVVQVPGKPVRVQGPIVREPCRMAAHAKMAEGVDADGQVVWRRELPGGGLVLPLDDGSAVIHVDRHGEAPTTGHLLPSGEMGWTHRWPQRDAAEPEGAEKPPDPRAFALLAFRGDEISVWFDERGVGGTTHALDRWQLDLSTGAIAGRQRFAFGDEIQMLSGQNAVYVIHAHDGGLDVIDLAGQLVHRGYAAASPAATGIASEAGSTLLPHDDGDTLVGPDRVQRFDRSGQPAWSFGTEASIVGAASIGDDVLVVTERCDAIAISKGEARWRTWLGHDHCHWPIQIAGDAERYLVVAPHGRKERGTAAALAANDGALTEQAELAEQGGVYPVVEDGVPRLRRCPGPKDSIALSGASARSRPTPAVAAVRWDHRSTEPVRSLAPLGADEALTLRDEQLWRFDGRRWTRRPPPRLPRGRRDPNRKVDDAKLHHLAAVGGELFAVAVQQSLVPYTTDRWAVDGEAFSLLTGARFARVSEVDARLANATVAPRVFEVGGDATLCFEDVCGRLHDGSVTWISLPAGFVVQDGAAAGDGLWLLGGQSVVRVRGDRAKEVHVFASEYRIYDSEIAAAGDDIWWFEVDPRVERGNVLHHLDAGTGQVVDHASPLRSPRDIVARGADDVWLVGEDGVAFFDGTRWLHLAEAGELSFDTAVVAGGAVWLAGASGVARTSARPTTHAEVSLEPKTPASPTTLVSTPRATEFARVSLRARPPVESALELAPAGDTLWVRDAHGVATIRKGQARRRAASTELGGFACHHCLAPTDGGASYVLGAQLFEVGAQLSEVGAQARPVGRWLDHALAVAHTRAGDLPLRIVGGADHALPPTAWWVDRGQPAWDVPAHCYAAAAADGDTTWLAGALRCKGDGLRWPDGEGRLVRHRPDGVLELRSPDGPLLDVVTAGDTTWAVGAFGTVIRVRGDEATSLRVAGAGRLFAALPVGGGVFFAGDGGLFHWDGTTLERWGSLPLPPRSVVRDLAVHDGRLWLASADGLLTTEL